MGCDAMGMHLPQVRQPVGDLKKWCFILLSVAVQNTNGLFSSVCTEKWIVARPTQLTRATGRCILSTLAFLAALNSSRMIIGAN
jgi:hypothetical protein